MDEFERSLKKVLVHEGGFVNHPADPGGATNKGIIQRVYDAWRDSMNLPRRSVQMILDDEVRAIYKREYWDRARCDKLAPGVSYVVFDGAVNSGVGQSVKWLQRSLKDMGLYAGLVDGIIGQGTLAAAGLVNDNDALVARMVARREAFLRALKTFKVFGKGWLSRTKGVLAVGQAWATGSVGPEVSYAPGGEKKAYVTDAKASPSRAPGDAATGAGGLSVLITQTQEQLTPYASIGFVAKAAAFLTIAGLVVAVGGIAYRFWAKKKADELKDALDLGAVPE